MEDTTLNQFINVAVAEKLAACRAESFRAELLISLDPHDALEGALAENFVACLWRLRRVPVFEARLYRRGAAQLLASQAAKEDRVREYQLTEDHELTEASILAALKKKKLGIWYGRFEDAEQRRARDQAELDDHATRMLENYPQPFLNLWRHEAALSRSLQKTLHDLERLQARRAGEHVRAPVVVDVDVSHGEPPRADIGGTGPSGEADGHQQ